MVAVLVTTACAARVPVVTDPAYPDYLFPTVPVEYQGAPAARSHNEAWTFLQVGDLVTADARYETILAQTPEFFPAQVGRGWVSMARDEPERAARYFEAATEDAPRYVPALVGFGEAMLALDRPAEAVESYQAALAVDGSLTEVRRVVDELQFALASDRLSVARAAAQAGRYTEATAAYRQLLEASPDSGFLHVELGRVEQRRGNQDAALAHARRASELDSFDPDAFLLEGELNEARGDLQASLVAYERADAVDPTDETARHIERVRDLMRLADLPSEMLDIASKLEVTRGELAALIGVRLSDLLLDASGRSVIITDTRDHWGAQWIQAVADAGVMDIDAAYRFSPAVTMRRSELADVVSATLDIIEEQTGSGPLGSSGTQGFSDMRPSHRSYSAAIRAVAAGVLATQENSSFQPSRTASGAEAVEMADRLSELAHASQ